MSDQMSYAGYACNGQGYLEPSSEQLNYNMPFTGTKETYGMPITVGAFFGMLNNFYNYIQSHPEVEQAFQDTYAIDFSKASLMRILSQPNCEYVRFHFAIPEPNQKISLAAQGLDAGFELIGQAHLLQKAIDNRMLEGDPDDPNTEERGNGRGGKGLESLGQIFEALKAHNSPLATADMSHLR
jgi:hypothetical protein